MPACLLGVSCAAAQCFAAYVQAVMRAGAAQASGALGGGLGGAMGAGMGAMSLLSPQVRPGLC